MFPVVALMIWLMLEEPKYNTLHRYLIYKFQVKLVIAGVSQLINICSRFQKWCTSADNQANPDHLVNWLTIQYKFEVINR
jgi:hypothetical protein